MGIKVCLDAGHYGKYNRSPAIGTYYESDMVWKLHNYLATELESYGIEIVKTRTNQANDKGLFNRGAMAKGCDLFLSMHSNAVGSYRNDSVDYPVAYVVISGSADSIGQKLAKCVETTMKTTQNGRINKRQGTGGDYYGVLRGAASVGVPGVILEHSFHTNYNMTKWLMDDNNLKAMAKAEAKVIAEHFGVKKTENGSTQTSTTTTTTTATNTIPKVPFTVQVIIDDLNYRSEPSMDGAVKGQTGKGVFTIVEVKDGWGKLKSGAGWIWLKNPAYCLVNKTIATTKPAATKKSNEEIAQEVLKGKWGNGADRKYSLEQAGYDYNTIQNLVNAKKEQTTKSLDEWANEVRNGKHGNGHANREASLKKAGCTYPYQQVRDRVNQLCK